MQVVEVAQPGVDTEARWVKKDGKSVFGYKQHTLVDDNGLVMAVETTAANQHDSKPMLDLLEKLLLNQAHEYTLTRPIVAKNTERL
jgi:transposase, IS5 family